MWSAVKQALSREKAKFEYDALANPQSLKLVSLHRSDVANSSLNDQTNNGVDDHLQTNDSALWLYSKGDIEVISLSAPNQSL